MADTFPNLRALAADAGRETTRRTKAGNAMYAGARASENRLFGDDLRGQEEAQQRGNSFQAHQAALDEALARREASMRQAAAMAEARMAQQERLKQRTFDREMEARENATWFDQQRFQTDENIRQAIAIAQAQDALGGDQVNSDDPRLSDFGRHEINPMRGQALELNPSGLSFSLTPEQRQRTQELISKHGEDPAKLIEEMRKLYGKRDRTASVALWDLGYRGPAGA